MIRWAFSLALAVSSICFQDAQAQSPLEQRTQKILLDLIRLKSVNPPGGETRTARYLESLAKQHGIECDVIGGDPDRLNFVARLHGSGEKRPLMLMAHSDVVPADPSQWTVPAFDGVIKDGYIYGRGAEDTLGLLAAEMAILIELKDSGAKLNRDLIVLSESDEEAGSTGIQWMVQNAWPKIDAEFALNEGGAIRRKPGSEALYAIQTTEKIPTRVLLRASGTAGHGSLPRPDNPVVHLARAIVKLSDAEQPVRMNTTVRRYFEVVSQSKEGASLRPLLAALDEPANAARAAIRLKAISPELAAMVQTTVSPTMLSAGLKINVIPNTAEAQVDVRRMPDETPEEIYERFRNIINDQAVEVGSAGQQTMPPTEPSSLTTELYKSMEAVFRAADPGALVAPFQLRGATDGSFLRQRGMAVYGVPVFDEGGRAHANDERIGVASLQRGVGLLMEIVKKVAQ
jgi:acetylornithine deacetylase/succinyl-diaminopimelate desuccinylase-like protein